MHPYLAGMLLPGLGTLPARVCAPVGCRGFIGPVPPPLSIRSSVVAGIVAVGGGGRQLIRSLGRRVGSFRAGLVDEEPGFRAHSLPRAPGRVLPPAGRAPVPRSGTATERGAIWQGVAANEVAYRRRHRRPTDGTEDELMTGMGLGPGPGPGTRGADLRSTRRLPIESGEVACPQRGALAARRCFACSWFAGAELQGVEPAIRCGFWRRLVVDEPGPLGLRLARAWERRGAPDELLRP